MKKSKKESGARAHFARVNELLAKLRPTVADTKELQRLEEKEPKKFAQTLREFDRRLKDRRVEKIPGFPKKMLKPASKSRSAGASEVALSFPEGTVGTVVRPELSLLAGLIVDGEIVCDCLVPFTFDGLSVQGNMSGPEMYEVTRGVLGAEREATSEYTVFNAGETQGTTRVHLTGSLHVSFSATLPNAGRYCLIIPSGRLHIRGHSRVVGHGNSSTSYDAKVWFDSYKVIGVEDELLELTGGEVHYDGTRSEDRTRNFEADKTLKPLYIFFDAEAHDEVWLDLRLEVDTAANEDGLAMGVVDRFGLLANSNSDFDTFAILSGG